MKVDNEWDQVLKCVKDVERGVGEDLRKKREEILRRRRMVKENKKKNRKKK